MEILYSDVEENRDYINYGHDLTTAGFFEEAGARAQESWLRAPTSSINRMLKYQEAEIGLVRESPKLSEEEWKESDYYRPDLKYTPGLNEATAEILAERKDAERERQDIMKRSEGTGWVRGGSMLAVDFATQFADPLNIASAFVPVFGEARFARMVGKYGVTKARAAKGLVEGGVGAAMVEPLVYGASAQEQADYDMYDSLMAVGMGTVFGGVIHTGAGKIGDVLGLTEHGQMKAKQSILAKMLRDEEANADPTLRAANNEGSEFSPGGAKDIFIERMATEKVDPKEINFTVERLNIVAKAAWERRLVGSVDEFYAKMGEDFSTKDTAAIFSKFENEDFETIIKEIAPDVIDIMAKADDMDAVAFKNLPAEEKEKLLNEFVEYMTDFKQPKEEMVSTFEKIKGLTLSLFEAENITNNGWKIFRKAFDALELKRNTLINKIDTLTTELNTKAFRDLPQRERADKLIELKIAKGELAAVNKKLEASGKMAKKLNSFDRVIDEEPPKRVVKDVKIEPEEPEYFTSNKEAAEDISKNEKAVKEDLDNDIKLMAKRNKILDARLKKQAMLGIISPEHVADILRSVDNIETKAVELKDRISRIIEC